jgi:outer membrane protein OmpA-like peptidoglycan-associated protein
LRRLTGVTGGKVKLKVSALALVAAAPALVLAYPAIGGGRGLFRVQNALVEQDAGLTLSLHGLARNAELSPDTSGWIGDIIFPELSYAPIANRYVGLELFGSWGGQLQYPMSSTYSELLAWGFHDLKAGGKLSVPIIPVLKLGGTASYTIQGRESSDPSRKDPDWVVLDPGALPYDTSAKLAWSGLATLQLEDLLLTAPNLMVNYGKVAGLTQYGAGVELHGGVFSIFVEALSRQTDSLSDGVLDTEHGHVQVTPGIAVGDATSWFLKAGYTFSLDSDASGVKRPNEVILGLGLATPLGRRVLREYGRIVGTVADANTGAPVAATVTFPDHPRLGKLMTEAGVFKATKVPAGAVTVEASADGYETRALPLMVENKKQTTAALMLRPLPVDITGKVSDQRTGDPLAATITVPEADSAVFRTEQASGVYRARLTPGTYSLVVESKGYLKQTAELVLEKERPQVKDFQLVGEGVAITLKGIYFDFDKATIKPESKPGLENAARILKENPTIKVEIQGHTDSVGSDEYNVTLSEKRAGAVVDYLVRNLGIDASRLTAKGYGEFQPVADNATEEDRALNRRVDFLVVDHIKKD